VHILDRYTMHRRLLLLPRVPLTDLYVSPVVAATAPLLLLLLQRCCCLCCCCPQACAMLMCWRPPCLALRATSWQGTLV
jgi:hypothetical protein